MRPTRLISFEKGELDLNEEDYQVQYGNPSFYTSPRPKFDAVYAPSYSKIEEDYKCIGKQIWRPDGEKVEPKETKEDESYEIEVKIPQSVENATEEEMKDAETPLEVGLENQNEHWTNLSWPKLRSLATKFTDEPVKSKEDAKEILQRAEDEGKDVSV